MGVVAVAMCLDELLAGDIGGSLEAPSYSCLGSAGWAVDITGEGQGRGRQWWQPTMVLCFLVSPGEILSGDSQKGHWWGLEVRIKTGETQIDLKTQMKHSRFFY